MTVTLSFQCVAVCLKPFLFMYFRCVCVPLFILFSFFLNCFHWTFYFVFHYNYYSCCYNCYYYDYFL